MMATESLSQWQQKACHDGSRKLAAMVAGYHNGGRACHDGNRACHSHATLVDQKQDQSMLQKMQQRIHCLKSNELLDSRLLDNRLLDNRQLDEFLQC